MENTEDLVILNGSFGKFCAFHRLGELKLNQKPKVNRIGTVTYNLAPHKKIKISEDILLWSDMFMKSNREKDLYFDNNGEYSVWGFLSIQPLYFKRRNKEEEEFEAVIFEFNGLEFRESNNNKFDTVTYTYPDYTLSFGLFGNKNGKHGSGAGDMFRGSWQIGEEEEIGLQKYNVQYEKPQPRNKK